MCLWKYHSVPFLSVTNSVCTCARPGVCLCVCVCVSAGVCAAPLVRDVRSVGSEQRRAIRVRCWPEARSCNIRRNPIKRKVKVLAQDSRAIASRRVKHITVRATVRSQSTEGGKRCPPACLSPGTESKQTDKCLPPSGVGS